MPFALLWHENMTVTLLIPTIGTMGTLSNRGRDKISYFTNNT